MSMENSFVGATSSTPNLVQKLNGKHFNDTMNKTFISKKQNCYKTQASSFLKTSINNMIKDQMRAYRLQLKLSKEVEDYKRQQQKKQLIADVHKIEKFRQKQSEALKLRFDAYLKEKQQKDSIAEEIAMKKRQMAMRKKQEHERKIQNVRKRYFQHQNDDIQNRLSRADSVQSHRSTHMSSITSRPRNIYTSLNSRHVNKQKPSDQEQKRITNYLKKMKHAQSRILDKQLKNEERKQKSIKSEIKNLTKERNQKEETNMKLLEDKFHTKMGSFYENLTRSQFQNSTMLMNKSLMKSQIRQRVIKNKQQNDSIFINRTIDNFMKRKADKQNLYRRHQNKIDMLRTKSSFMNNTIQIQKQYLEKQNQKSIRILYQKLNKVKNLQANQTLMQKQKQALISLLDDQDPLYPEMVEFLSNTKGQFLRKKIQKQEERLKSDKTKKTARFNNKN